MTTYVIILVAVIVLAVPSIILVNKHPKSRPFFQVLFFILIVVLGYLLFYNIRKPIEFDKELNKRYSATVERLKDIRSVQIAYKDKYGKFAGSFDTLKMFIKTDSFEIQRIEQTGVWDQDALTREQAFKKGILKKYSSYIPVKDSLWKKKVYDVADLSRVPFISQEYTLGAGEVVTGSKVKVKVFEAYVLYIDLLSGLDDQLISNYIDEKTKWGAFQGIKVGSLIEANNNAGNWEQ